jgi:quercetin dioxygenase-like cupin family protein
MNTQDQTTADRADLPGLGTRYLIRSSETEGRFALIEHTIAPRTLGAPMHTHANEDEYSFVLSGTVGAQVGDRVLSAGPGEIVVKPRGIQHAFWNAGDTEARLLELISPGDFGEYFAELSPVLMVDGPPDFARVGEIQGRYGLTMDVEGIGALMAEHGLAA